VLKISHTFGRTGHTIILGGLLLKSRPTPTQSPVQFPNPRILPDDSDGLIYIGGNLELATLLKAYRSGIFPWPLDSQYPLFWFCPQPRGVIDFKDLHVPKSLAKLRRQNKFRFTFNQAFTRVMQACSDQPRPGQEGTWIIPELLPAYNRLHEAGYAHSIECWQGPQLVGGLYGIFVDGVFSGESMFHLAPNASKLCLIEMAEALQAKGITWMDIQMLTPVTESLGGHYLTRSQFLDRLDLAHQGQPREKLLLP